MQQLLRRVAHLMRRFFQVMTARPLAPDEQAEAAGLLGTHEAALYWGMAPADQRHSLDAARSVATAAPQRRDLQRAALLHDVGKRHSALGLWGRSLASGLQLLHLPVAARHRTYLEHGTLGADDLEAGGAEAIVVSFARHHHRPEPPPGIADSDWALLRDADGE